MGNLLKLGSAAEQSLCQSVDGVAASQFGWRSRLWGIPLRRRALHLVQTEDFQSSMAWYAQVKGCERYLPGLRVLWSRQIDGIVELKDDITRLRRQLIWLNLLRRRRYDQPQPQYLYVKDFLWFLTYGPRKTITNVMEQCLGSSRDSQSDARTRRTRLAMLQPMPLAVLEAYHQYRCKHEIPSICYVTSDYLRVEYVALFCAVQACWKLAQIQRAASLQDCNEEDFCSIRERLCLEP